MIQLAATNWTAVGVIGGWITAVIGIAFSLFIRHSDQQDNRNQAKLDRIDRTTGEIHDKVEAPGRAHRLPRRPRPPALPRHHTLTFSYTP